MKSINEKMVRKLAYEERLALYRLADDNQFSSDEVYGLLRMVEDLTKVYLNSTEFDGKSIGVLGIDNCCNFFKALCEQYHDLVAGGEDAEFLARQQKMGVSVGSKILRVKDRTVDIGLYDAATSVKEAVDANYRLLLNGSMKANRAQDVYEYATYYTFSGMYYSLRDLIEGKTYRDNDFFTEYRELPAEYEQKSENLVRPFMDRVGATSYDSARAQLLKTLNDGVTTLSKAPLKEAFAIVESKAASV